ncbi:MAG: hypothetical protein AB7I19_09985 [Planctomycetota bacterium]
MSRLLLALAAFTASLAAQSGCPDQVYEPTVNNGLEITANQTVTQTFTAGVSGQLTDVFLVGIQHHRGTPTTPLEIRIVATDTSGTPSGAALATFVLTPAQVPAARGNLQLDVRAASIVVSPGTVLGIRASSAATPGGSTYAWWGEAAGVNYPRGMIFLRDTTPLSVWDLGFRTHVLTPASSANYGTGHPGTLGVPTLAASAPPVLGSNLQLLIGNSNGSTTTGALLAGIATANLPTPFGGTVLLTIDSSISTVIPTGGLAMPLAIPSSPRLCGARVFFQSIQFDTGASHSLAFSPGLEFVLGG